MKKMNEQKNGAKEKVVVIEGELDETSTSTSGCDCLSIVIITMNNDDA